MPLSIISWLASGILAAVMLLGSPWVQSFSSFMFLPSGATYTTQYYVDSVGGSDSNNGLTISTPFQTLAKMQTVCGTLGNLLPQWTQINLKRGSTWTGASAFLFIDVSNVKIIDYGIGALPFIDGRIQMNNASFSLTAGQTYTYQWQGIGLNTGAENHNVFEAGVRLTRQTSIALVEANAGSYFAPAESAYVQGSPYLIYVHSKASTNIITDGVTYSTQGVQQVVAIGSTTSLNAQVYNLSVVGGSHHNGNIQMGRSSYVNNVVSKYGIVHSIYTDSGYFVNCFSYDSEDNCLDFVANKGSSADGFTEMNGCVVDNQDTADDVIGNAFFVHGSTHITIRYINCIARHKNNGFGVVGTPGTAQTILCDGCTMVCGNVAGGTNWAYSFNDQGYVGACTMVVHNCIADNYGYLGYAYGAKAGSVMNVQTCRAVVQGYNLAFRPGLGTINASYCSIFCAAGAYAAAEVDSGATNFTFNNCIIDHADIGIESYCTTSGVYGADNNVYHQTSSPMAWRYAGTYYASWAAYITAVTAEDQHSVYAAPQWACVGGAPGAANSYDFSLMSTSPAIPITAGFTFGP